MPQQRHAGQKQHEPTLDPNPGSASAACHSVLFLMGRAVEILSHRLIIAVFKSSVNAEKDGGPWTMDR